MRNVVLAMLSDGPLHGYEITRRYDRLFEDVWGPLNVGQVYVILGRLERDGLVEHHRAAQPKGPARKMYALTDLGRKFVESWLEEDTPLPTTKSDVVLRVVAAEMVGHPTPRAVIGAHRQRCLEALRALDQQAAEVPAGGLSELLVQGAALHLQAELRWLDLCDQRIRTARHQLAAAAKKERDAT